MASHAAQEAPLEGRDAQPVQISPYDAEWPARYEAEKAVLEETLGNLAVGGIHHVGSTAITGLDAEPVIDILVGIEDPAAVRACSASLECIGYLPRQRWDQGVRSFHKPHIDLHGYELHLAPVESRRYSEMLSFRDLLRRDRQAAFGYAALKRDLVERGAGDREAYATGKAQLIQAVLGRSAGTVVPWRPN